MDIYTNSQLLI